MKTICSCEKPNHTNIVKQHLSALRTKLIAARKNMEASHKKRVEPLREAVKNTLKIELEELRQTSQNALQNLEDLEEGIAREED